MATLINQQTFTLPAGLTTRQMRLEDAEAIVALFNRCSQALLGINGDNVDDCLSAWQTPGFDYTEDVLLVVDEHDQPVGYGEHWDTAEPHVRKHSYAEVDPNYTGQGIGGFLLDWIVGRAQATIDRAPAETRVSIDQSLPVENKAGQDVLVSRGFTHIRTYYQMRITMEQKPQVEIPAGIDIRPLRYPEDFPAAIQAFRESFQDHWGFVADPFEQTLKRWTHFVENDKDFNPEIWYMAMDGEQVAGICFCSPKTDEDPEMAWVNTLGVCRPWRKHGVGLALLNHAFANFWQRGTRKVGLGVDGSSLTGATRLYERAGMRIARQFPLYEKELRAGVDLARQKLD